MSLSLWAKRITWILKKMDKLYEKIKHFTFLDALKFENNDRQFIALKKLYENYGNSNKYKFLALIICNSLICYQLSWKWEDYWEEFSEFFSIKNNFENIVEEVSLFMKNSKNNKRLIDIKIRRLEKLKNFIMGFEWKEKYYYENMIILRNDLAKIMNQKQDSKTIVFAVKMFGYWARNIYDFIEYPRDINIPLDSRLKFLFEKYKWDYVDINKFYLDLSNKLNMSPLHLDWIIWNLYYKL